MIARCQCCGKPLNEFETSFHKEAASPSSISGKCWSCSGAEKQFKNGYVDKPNHRLEIFVCIIAIAIIIALFSPLVPYLNSYDTPEHLQNYPYLFGVGYVIVGLIATLIIRRDKNKKPTVQQWDPPMTRYEHIYGPDTDYYKTSVNAKGDYITTKETRYGGKVKDHWGHHSLPNSSFWDKIITFYAGIFAIGFAFCITMMIAVTFAFWVLPYIFVKLTRDKKAKKSNKSIPKQVKSAYRNCRKKYGVSPISYDDKVSFLISKENCQSKKSERRNDFLSNFKGDSTADPIPFFYTRKKKVSYMIVDYKRASNKNFGVTFLLVDNGKNGIQKQIVVGNGFVPSSTSDWRSDWTDAGVSSYAMQHMEWYEQKMQKIMKSSKKNSDVAG